MKTEEVLKILEENKITNVHKKKKEKEEDWWDRHKSYIEHRKEFPYYPEKNKGVVPRSAYQVDEPNKGEKKEMSEFVILTSLAVIIGLLGFIAFMIFIIGYNIDKSHK